MPDTRSRLHSIWTRNSSSFYSFSLLRHWPRRMAPSSVSHRTLLRGAGREECNLFYFWLGKKSVPLTFHKPNKTCHWLTPQNLHCWVKKDLSGGFLNSEFTPLGRSLFPWVAINANEAMIKNSLILKIITYSAAKATAAQQRSLISLAKVVLEWMMK